jgi:hypothetical protein
MEIADGGRRGLGAASPGEDVLLAAGQRSAEVHRANVVREPRGLETLVVIGRPLHAEGATSTCHDLKLVHFSKYFANLAPDEDRDKIPARHAKRPV